MPAPNDPAGGSEVLSQSEVERLLAQVAEQAPGASSSPVLAPSQEAPPAKDRESAQPYDFRHPSFLAAGEMRRLRLRQEEFVRALSARLSMFLRLEFSLQLSKLHTLPYHKFAKALPNPAHLSLFKIEPLRGVGILDIHPRLGLTMVDRLLGGPAHSITADHDFSEIEIALLDQVVQLILAEWCQHWASLDELRPTLLGHENNGQFLQTAPHDTVMLVLAMEAKVGDCLEQMQLALPCFSLEGLIRKLAQTPERATQEPRPLPVPTRWNPNFDDVPVPVTAIWDMLVLSAREIANLKPGDVLPLDPRCSRQVKLRVGDVTKFEGHLGTSGGRWAVAITQSTKGSLAR